MEPFGVDPIFSGSSSLIGGVDLSMLENIITFRASVSELPNGFRVRSSDLKKGKWLLYISIS